MLKITKLRFLYILPVLLLGLAVFAYLRPLPPIQSSADPLKIETGVGPTLPWPGYGQSAIGAVGYGLLDTSGAQSPAPIASIAKVVTALAVLEQKPLTLGEQGPLISLDKTDVDYFNYYYSNDGSVVRVNSGQQISQYQALQALLLPSANNLADSLARWAFGSVEAYVTYANNYVKILGLGQTTIGSPSGFSANSTSTASDLVGLGIRALANPVFAQIVSQKSATIAGGGEIHNVNWLLGTDGVNGIKTGNTTEAGGCYLFSSLRQIEGNDITVVGAVMSAPTRDQAIRDARPVIAASSGGFKVITPIRSGQVVAIYKTNWGATTAAVAQSDLSLVVWLGQPVSIKLDIKPLVVGSVAGTAVGSVAATSGSRSVNSLVATKSSLASPSLGWRLQHPNF